MGSQQSTTRTALTRQSSSAAIKRHNRSLIADYLYRHDYATMLALEHALALSRPTVRANLLALQREGLVSRGERLASTGGRKAQAYAFAPSAHTALGVRLHRHHSVICAIDLHGSVLAKRTLDLDYANADAFFQRIGAAVQNFAEQLAGSGSPALGVAFSMQGLVSADARSITFGNILGNTGLSLDTIAQSIELPCLLIHDSDASAMAELWSNDGVRDALCVYLGARPGGAVVIDGTLRQGRTRRNGTIEHMTLVPGGRPCYCGQRGCMDPYCSCERLTEGDFTDLPEFFAALRDGNAPGNALARSRFDAWIGYLAQAIANARTVLCADVILGGELAQHLNDEDLRELKSRIDGLSAFGADEYALRFSICAPDQDVIGAALRYVEPFVARLCGQASARA